MNFNIKFVKILQEKTLSDSMVVILVCSLSKYYSVYLMRSAGGNNLSISRSNRSNLWTGKIILCPRAFFVSLTFQVSNAITESVTTFIKWNTALFFDFVIQTVIIVKMCVSRCVAIMLKHSPKICTSRYIKVFSSFTFRNYLIDKLCSLYE